MDATKVFTNTAGVQYPIIHAPMLGSTSPQMVAAITNAGGLGSLPVGGLSPEKTIELIHQTKALTHKPFSVNLFAHSVPDYNADDVERMQAFLARLCAENGIPYAHQDVGSFKFYTYHDQINILIKERIPVVSFTFGVIDKEHVRAMQDAGMVIMGTATCLREAQILDELGCDMICAQGIEAGGHRGTFIEDEPLPMIGTMALVTQMVNRIDKPVIAAGGIADGKTIRAAFQLGAAAVQPGTVFLASDEALCIPSHKAALADAKDTDAGLTRAFSGRWARGLKNQLMTEMEAAGITIPPYPIQNSLTQGLRAIAQKQDNKEMTNLWAGQAAFKARKGRCEDIFRSLITEAGL